MPSVDRLKRQLLELAILTLITVAIWIGYEVYNALTQPSQAQVTEEELRPIPADLDVEQLDRLKTRLVLSDEELRNFPISKVIISEEINVSLPSSPTAQPSPASPSAEIE